MNAASTSPATPAAPAAAFDTMPRAPLIAAGLVVLAALLGASWVRLSGAPIRAPDAPVAVERALRFEDRTDGSIAVVDARTGMLVDSVSGQAGFVRGTLRGMARERKRQGVGAEPPFVLIGRTDGRLTLSDPSTGRLVDLDSFGPVNSGVFAHLLRAAPAAR